MTLDTRPSLTSFPAEIRYRVYHYLFQDSSVRVHYTTKDPYSSAEERSTIQAPRDLDPRFKRSNHILDFGHFHIALTQTSSLIRAETLPRLIASTWKVQVCSYRLVANTDQTLNFRTLGIPVLLFQSLQQLSIDYWIIRHLPPQPTAFPNLKVMKIKRLLLCSGEWFPVGVFDMTRSDEQIIQCCERELHAKGVIWEMVKFLEKKAWRNYAEKVLGLQVLCQILFENHPYNGPHRGMMGENTLPKENALRAVVDLQAKKVVEKRMIQTLGRWRRQCQWCDAGL